MSLEVCRGLVKAGFPAEKVGEAYGAIEEMNGLGFIEPTPVGKLRERAKDLILGLNLYVADALSLACALVREADLITEDRHLLRQSVKGTMRTKGLKVMTLNELYKS